MNVGKGKMSEGGRDENGTGGGGQEGWMEEKKKGSVRCRRYSRMGPWRGTLQRPRV